MNWASRKTLNKPQPPPRPIHRGCIVVGVLAVVFGGLGVKWLYEHYLRADVVIYVDNTSDEPMTVTVDGLWTSTVPAHEMKTVYYRHGQRHFVVTQNEKTLLEGNAPLKAPKSNSEGAMMKYILNPDRGGRYWQADIDYGHSPIMPSMSPLLNLPVRTSADAMQRVASEIHMLEHKGPWFNIEFADYAFEEPIPGKIPGIGWMSKTTVEKMSQEDFEVLSKAKQQQEEVDQETLDRLINRVNRLLTKASP